MHLTVSHTLSPSALARASFALMKPGAAAALKVALVVACCTPEVCLAGARRARGPVVSLNIADPSLPDGVGSLGLKADWSAELKEGVAVGLRYSYDDCRDKPSALWVSTSGELTAADAASGAPATTLTARAEYDTASAATTVEARFTRGEDEAIFDFNTATGEAGPLRARKALDIGGGRRLTLLPRVHARERTGALAVRAEVEPDQTAVLLELDHKAQSASLEVERRLDDYNVISPKVNLRTGDVSVRLDRALESGGLLEVHADKSNIDWQLQEDSWTVKGNIPLDDATASTITFKRTIDLS